MGHENLQVEMIEGVAEGAGLAAGEEDAEVEAPFFTYLSQVIVLQV